MKEHKNADRTSDMNNQRSVGFVRGESKDFSDFASVLSFFLFLLSFPFFFHYSLLFSFFGVLCFSDGPALLSAVGGRTKSDERAKSGGRFYA